MDPQNLSKQQLLVLVKQYKINLLEKDEQMLAKDKQLLEKDKLHTQAMIQQKMNYNTKNG